MQAKFFGLGLSNLATAKVDWVADTVKVALTTSAYAINPDTHDFFNDVTNEIAGTGYSAGGVALASKARTWDSVNKQLKLDADDAVWSAATITAHYAVIYKSTGVAATSPLIGYIDFGSDQSVTARDFTLVWSPNGVFRIKGE